MRTFKALLLAAAAISAGVPAVASAQRWGDRGGQQQGGDAQRPDNNNGGGRPDRGNWQRGGDNGQRAQQDQQRAQQDQARAQQDQIRVQQDQIRAQQDQQRTQQQGRQFDRGDRGDRRPDFRPGDDRRPDFRPGNDNRPGFRGDPRRDDRRPDFRPGGPGGDRGFNRDWRNDRRYDWRGYRNQNRNIFRGPRYVAPRGWSSGYRRFGIGVAIPSFFFGQQYWLSDPYEYRLPPAYGNTRWIRYYNDVLLVDIYTGRVIDVIPDFFF